jgi:hypothetical protein
MKFVLFRYSFPLVYSLSAMVLVLLLTTSFLYHQKTKTQSYNRVLILQNDSLLSEQIRLKNAIPRTENSTGDKTHWFPQPAIRNK